MRYEARGEQFQQIMYYNMNQKKLFVEFDGQVFGGNDSVPDAEESLKFWSEIWDSANADA